MHIRARQMYIALLALLLAAFFALPAALADALFTVDNGRLTAYNGPGGEVSVPQSIRVIGREAFAYNTDVTQVNIGYYQSIREIEAYAFAGCTELTYVDSIGNAEVVGAGAFFGCASLTSAWLSEEMTEIPSQLFYGCESLSDCRLPNHVISIGASAFYGCMSLTSIALPGDLTVIKDKAFANCTGLEKIVLPATVTSVGAKAFAGCGELSRITVLSDTAEIASDAFPKNAGLVIIGYEGSTAQTWAENAGVTFEVIRETSEADDFTIENGVLTDYRGKGGHVVVPEGVTKINGWVFDNEEAVLSVTLPQTVTELGNGAFSGCSNLECINLPEGMTSIGYCAFYGCRKLASVALPRSLTSLGYGAFWNCDALETVTIPGGVDTVEENTFNGCDALRSVTIEEGVHTLMYQVFQNCPALESVSLPQSLKSVGSYAFGECASLESIAFPSGVKKIDYCALNGCKSLEAVRFEGADTQIPGDLLNDESHYPIIYGHYGSTAETFARDYGFEFSGCDCCTPETVCEHLYAYQDRTTQNHTYTATGALKTHSVTYDVYTYTTCPDCGARYGYAYAGTGTDTSDHSWDEYDLCYSCGQQNACLHENTELYTYKSHVSYVNVDAPTTHIWVYNLRGYTECLDCGKRLTEDALIASNQGDTQDHWWNEENVCGSCGYQNACLHENISRWTSYDRLRYASTGDYRYHTAHYDRYEESQCEDCNLWFEPVLLESGVVDSWDHSWNEDGVCYYCKQVNLCPHANIDSWTHWENDVYTYTGDYLYHSVTYDRYGDSRCDDCGLGFDAVLEEAGATQTQKHSWGEDGVCTGCKHANDCPHENKRTNTYWENETYTSTGDHGMHAFTYDVYERVRCSDCETLLSNKFVEKKTRDERHSWDEEGVCRNCEQVNACPHEGRIYEEIDYGESEYAPLDRTHHTRTQRFDVQVYCAVCRMQIDTREGGTFERLEEHSFSGGKCRRCGKADASGEEGECAHKEQYRDYDTIERSCTDLGDGTHMYKRVREYCMYCEDCGEQVGEPWEETTESIQLHDYKNRCDSCGYSAECAHTDTHSYTDWLDSRYEAIDETTHAQYARVKTYTECNGCGKMLSETEDKVETLVSRRVHGFSYGDTVGVCDECGYKNPCAHEHTAGIMEQVTTIRDWTANDEYTCSQTAISAPRIYCTDCGENLRTYGEFTEVTRTQEHSFWEGKCDACGYENPCAHGETTEETWYDYWGSAEYVDENTHRIYATEYTEIYCALCGEYMGDRMGERAWIERPHELCGSECEYGCGYKVPCAHENTTFVVLPESYFESCTPVSSAEHETAYPLYRYLKCEDCGTVLREMGDTFAGYKTVTEAHEFAGGVCSGCGYAEIVIPEPDPDYIGTISGDTFFNLDWTAYKDKLAGIGLEKGGAATLTDLATGLTMQIYVQSTGNHADVEPLTAADTAAMCRMYGVAASDKIGWKRRAMVMTLRYMGAEIPVVCSVYGEPHGQDTIADNDYDGQFCVHFLNSTNHAGTGDTVTDGENHQAMIKRAVAVLLSQGKTLKTSLTDEDVSALNPNRPKGETREAILSELGAKTTSVYRLGSTGKAVAMIQQMMLDMEIYEGEVTGNFGVKTQSAVTALQQARGLTANGECRYLTLINLIDAYLGIEETECPHANTGESAGAQNETRTYVNDNVHEYAFDAVITVRCCDCGEVVETREAGSFAWNERHLFNINGVECACGMTAPGAEPKIPCAHESVTPRIYKTREWAYRDLEDGLHHEVTRTGDMYNICDACGERVGDGWTGSETHTAEHDYRNGCPSCGFSAPCAHETPRTTLAYEENETRTIDDARHGVYGFVVRTTHCADCGEMIDEEWSEEEALLRTAMHDFSSDGLCSSCGAENACKHEHTAVKLERSWSLEGEPVDAGEAVHEITRVYIEYTVCTDCGATVGGMGKLVMQTAYEPHWYDYHSGDRVCDACGHQNACAHENTYERERRGEWWGSYYVDESTHMQDAERTVDTLCRDCGATLSSEDFPRTQTILPHNFENGECTDCYYRPCAHENAQRKVVTDRSSVISARSVSDVAHELLCEKKMITYCPDCDMQLEESGVSVGTASILERHDLRGGVCVVCGGRPAQPGRAITLTLPGKLKVIEAEAFAGGAYTEVIAPDGLEAIGARAFAGCTALRIVTIPESVTQIAADAFEGASPAILGESGSEAERFAKAQGLAFLPM